MTTDQINAVIAETQGWDYLNYNWFLNGVRQDVYGPPNYHGSLDAIVPVVRNLPEEELELVWDNLQFSVMRSQAICFCALATPAQWCEAYLKAKGLLK